MWNKWRTRWAGSDQIRQIEGAPIMVAYGVELIAQAIADAQDRAAAGVHLLIIGVMRDNTTKRWHIGISRSGRDFTWVSAYGSKQHADTQIEWIIYAARQNNLEDDESYAAFMRELQIASEFEP